MPGPALASQATEKFVPIYRASLVTNTVLDFDVYVRFGPRYVLFRGKDLVYTGEIPDDLAVDLKDILFVKAEERQKYLEYLERNLKSIVEDPDVEENVKAGVLVETSKNVVTNLFENPDMGGNIERASTVVEGTVDFVLHGKEAIQNLLVLCSHDYYTYSHCVNVSVYAITLGRRLGHKGQDLRDIGLGAVLHDVGKIKVPDEIINKDGPLTREEFEEMKKHPTYSYEIIKKEGMTEAIAAPGHEHHERIAGGGYPRGIRGNQMHPYSKICAVGDSFDAMTTNRAYRKAFTSFEAMKIMNAEMRGSFDSEVLTAFVLLMAGK